MVVRNEQVSDTNRVRFENEHNSICIYKSDVIAVIVCFILIMECKPCGETIMRFPPSPIIM